MRACRCRGTSQFVHVSCLQRWLQCRPGGAAGWTASTATSSMGASREPSENKALQWQCEVCKSPYTVRIQHRSHFDPQRCCSARSCETYFECGSLLVTLVMLITTPWLVWEASSLQERQAILSHWPLLLITALFMVALSLLALRKMFCRWRRSQISTIIHVNAVGPDAL